MEKAPKPVSAIAPFGLRMQPALKDALNEAAKANARSLNAEIVARLEASFRLPGRVAELMTAYRAVEATHDEESELTKQLIDMYEAQKSLNDMQQKIIDALIKDHQSSDKKTPT